MERVFAVGAPSRRLYAVVGNPCCPICGRDSRKEGAFIYCPVHGYMGKSLAKSIKH